MRTITKQYGQENNAPAKSPSPGDFIVTHNGVLKYIELEDPKHFKTKEKAMAYAEDEAKIFPGLVFVVCKIYVTVTGRVIKELDTKIL